MIKALFDIVCHILASRITNKIERFAKKLRRVILQHYGLVIFRIHFGKDRTPIIFMIFRCWVVSMTPKTNLIYLWRHWDIPNISKENPDSFTHIFFSETENVELPEF